MSKSRRDFVNDSVMAGLGLTGLTGAEGMLGSLLQRPARQSLDTFEILSSPWWRLQQSFSLTPEALAMQGGDETCIITIRVMNLIHTPLCLKFLDYTGSDPTYTIGLGGKMASPAAVTMLRGKGIDLPSDIPRFKALGLNKWFADILNSGLDETGKRLSVIADGEIGAFPEEDKVAFQTVMHLNQNDSKLNHAFQQTLLPSTATPGKGGDLNCHLAENKIIKSPLGITVLTMGSGVETTNGFGFIGNRAFGFDGRSVVATGQTVDKYIGLIEQNIGGGFVNDELLGKFDGLTEADLTMRDTLKAAREELAKSIGQLRNVASAAATTHTMAGVTGAANNQAFAKTGLQEAKLEFVAQCLFVKRLLEIPGKPFRNFSLFLNIHDPDGDKLDAPSSQGGREPLGYIEAMRQLGIGMNILAKSIEKQRDVYVVMFSEGGRGANMGDNKASHAFIMGPGGTGNLKDHLYANKGAIADPKSPLHGDPNEGKADSIVDSTPGFTGGGGGLFSYSDSELKAESGAKLDGFGNVGILVNGVLRHLEAKTGVEPTGKGLGPYLEIQKK